MPNPAPKPIPANPLYRSRRGRPKKDPKRERMMAVTSHMAPSLVGMIDAYMGIHGNRADFIRSAVKSRLRELGILPTKEG